jgi:Tim10/DDP family zinc finger
MLQELQVKEAIELMGIISRRCFTKCITKFDSIDIAKDEDQCLKKCATKSLKFNQQLNEHFQKYGNISAPQ